MKTVQKGQDIKRVNDVDAESLVKHKGYSYVPKSVLKTEKKKEEPKAEAVVSGTPKEKFKKGSKK